MPLTRHHQPPAEPIAPPSAHQSPVPIAALPPPHQCLDPSLNHPPRDYPSLPSGPHHQN